VGRICAVCDVFDALTSERPYKKAWTFEAAVKEIKRMSGTNFDPKVVEAFVRILPQIKAISRDVGRA
jgi:putative two-component system response regulator